MLFSVRTFFHGLVYVLLELVHVGLRVLDLLAKGLEPGSGGMVSKGLVVVLTLKKVVVMVVEGLFGQHGSFPWVQ